MREAVLRAYIQPYLIEALNGWLEEKLFEQGLP